MKPPERPIAPRKPSKLIPPSKMTDNTINYEIEASNRTYGTIFKFDLQSVINNIKENLPEVDPYSVSIMVRTDYDCGEAWTSPILF